MPIGNNMKRKKLIPDEPKVEEKAIKKEAEKKQESVQAKAVETKAPVEKKEEASTLGFIVEPSRRKSVKKAKVFIEGELSIYNTQELLSKIKEVLNQYDMVDFKIRNVKDIDLSAVQVLYYVKKHHEESDKQLTFQIEELGMELKSLLVKTKYNKLLFKKPNPTS